MSLSREMILSRVRWSIDAERVSVALLRLGLVLRGYDPNQPRVPAGSSEGGQWTDGGEGGSYPSEDGAWITLVSDNDDRRLSVDLGEEEARGGHTLRKHLGRTDDEMRERVQRSAWWTMPGRGGLRRNGTFASQDAATNLINQTLRKNAEIVNEVASGKTSERFLTSRFNERTGREAYSTNDGITYLRDTFGVGVLIRHDPRSPRGYRVHTAYPRNDGD